MTALQGDYAGRVAVVTGGTQGLGAALALRLAQWGAAGLVTCGLEAEGGEAVRAEVEALGTRCVFVRADLTEPASCAAVVEAARAAFGRLDGLANVAGTTERGGLLDGDAALFDRVFALNVRAPFLLTQAAARLMIDAGRPGAVVNMGSMNAHAGIPRLAVYSASKGALATLTRNAAHSLRVHRIRVNAINLGWADTPAERATQAREHPDGERWLAVAEAAMPFGRLIKPDDVADLAAFLLSDHSGLMTGSVIDHEQWIAGVPP